LSYLIYADGLSDFNGGNFSIELLRDQFAPAAGLNEKLQAKGYRLAYMFIDPLLDSFEAANKFYFGILGCREISKLNHYRSGCGPVQAMSDAETLIANDICDAVMIFGHEPLASLKTTDGKETLNRAMDIYAGVSLPEAYNRLTHEMLKILGISEERYFSLADALYENYRRTYLSRFSENPTVAPPNRQKRMTGMNADLFTLTDCAFPYVDFAGGVILASAAVADDPDIPAAVGVEVKSAEYQVVGDGPDCLHAILGREGHLYPHLQRAYQRACARAGIDFKTEFYKGNAIMEVYTCYPPTPMGFLLSTGFTDVEKMIDFLDEHEITVTGGMNFARAPWNNPVLNALIALCKRLPKTDKTYALVHGNGGLGAFQGVAILSKEQPH
jgi:hypothetical protein